MKILVTGGAGFIGSAVVRHIINNTNDAIINVDKLTYAGNLESLNSVCENNRYTFIQADICDAKLITDIFKQHQPDAIMHLAAESHVDRSIDGPSEFIQTNIIGTYTLLEAARQYWNAPSSPYSASKASSDHLVRAWQRTYGLPTIVTNCSNNYGPFHYPEKLIPLIILNALEGKALPVYGNGQQIRDWLYVEDHARALYKVVTEGKIGETYNIGGHNEKANIDVVKTICSILEELVPNKPNNIENYSDLITYVTDRPGHDLRYAIDATKIKNELNWVPDETFETGLRKTVEWYLKNSEWCESVQNNKYNRERLGA